MLATSGPVTWQSAITSLILAFGLSQVVAMTYMASFRGMSYSRNFVQSIALGSIITCMLLLAIAGNVVFWRKYETLGDRLQPKML